MFIAVKALVANRFQSKIITLYSDNGGEFVALHSFLITQEIFHLTAPPHTPEHNGVSEAIIIILLRLDSHSLVISLERVLAICFYDHRISYQ